VASSIVHNVSTDQMGIITADDEYAIIISDRRTDTKGNHKDQNFNELHLHLVRFLTFLCGYTIQAVPMKTGINSKKNNKKTY
jgi:hypothetical protein